MRPVRFQSTAPTTNAYPSGSDWAPRSHRGPVERLSQRERLAFRPGSGHLLGEFSFNSPSCVSETFLDSRHGDATLGRKFSNGRLVNMAPVQQLSLGFGNRVQGAALRPKIVVFASIGAAERQGLGSRGMAMPAGKDAVGGVASGVDLGGQPLSTPASMCGDLGQMRASGRVEVTALPFMINCGSAIRQRKNNWRARSTASW